MREEQNLNCKFKEPESGRGNGKSIHRCPFLGS